MVATNKIFEETIQTDHKVITEELSKSILKSYGVKVPPYALVTSAEDAANQAKKIGFPLVMKVVSPQILHKTDVGGVKVGFHLLSIAKSELTIFCFANHGENTTDGGRDNSFTIDGRAIFRA